MADYTKQIIKYIRMEKQVLDALPVDAISDIMNVLENARLTGKRIFVTMYL